MTPYEIGQRDAFQKFAGSGLGALIGGGLGALAGQHLRPGLGGAIGGAIGTAGGAILGNQFSDENSTPVGSAVGGLVGAPVGGITGGLTGGIAGGLGGLGLSAILRRMGGKGGPVIDASHMLGDGLPHTDLAVIPTNRGGPTPFGMLHDSSAQDALLGGAGAALGAVAGTGLGSAGGAFLGARTGHRIADKHNEKKQRRADEGLMADINKQDEAPAEGGA